VATIGAGLSAFTTPKAGRIAAASSGVRLQAAAYTTRASMDDKRFLCRAQELKLPHNEDVQASNLRPLAPDNPESVQRNSRGRNSLFLLEHQNEGSDADKNAEVTDMQEVIDDAPVDAFLSEFMVDNDPRSPPCRLDTQVVRRKRRSHCRTRQALSIILPQPPPSPERHNRPSAPLTIQYLYKAGRLNDIKSVNGFVLCGYCAHKPWKIRNHRRSKLHREQRCSED
jgi:hypothetical protein